MSVSGVSGRPGFNYGDVAGAAERLIARGERVTLKSVRCELGGGSMNTIQKHLGDWRAKRQSISGALVGHEAPPLPPDQRVTVLIEQMEETASTRLLFALGALMRQAQETNDTALASTVRLEGNICHIFKDVVAIESFQSDFSGLVHAADISYLRYRAAETQNLIARVGYLHAIAIMTKSHDDGSSAASAYLDAIAYFMSMSTENSSEAFHAFLKLFPIAISLAPKYGLTDRLKSEVFRFILEGDEHFAHAKTKILKLIVENRRIFSVEDLLRLREVSLSLLISISGSDEIQKFADVGRHLADRIGEHRRAWDKKEAEALEERLSGVLHPFLVEMHGTRLRRLYQLLGEGERRKVNEERMNSARSKQEFHEFSGQVDGWSEQVKYLQKQAKNLFNEHGAIGSLAFIANTSHLLPSVSEVRNHIDEMHKDGIGVFRSLAQVFASAGDRIISYEDNEFFESYDIRWLFGSVAPFGVLMEELLSSGDVKLEHFQQFLESSWMGREENISYGAGERMPNDLVRLILSNLRIYIGLRTDEFKPDARISLIDSLTLRFEAIFRKLARLLGIQDNRTNDRGITEVRGLDLLKDQGLVDFLGEDLLAFTAQTLNKPPEGLRDRVAHSILHAAQYRIEDMDALVLLLLRIAALQVGVRK